MTIMLIVMWIVLGLFVASLLLLVGAELVGWWKYNFDGSPKRHRLGRRWAG